MDYEKKYKEALETARKINNGEGVAAPPDWTVYEVIFPELRESKEKEKIKNALIAYFKAKELGIHYDFPGYFQVEYKDVLAWLEKQDEQKSAVNFKAKDWYVSKVDGKIHDMTYSPNNKDEKSKWTDYDDNILDKIANSLVDSKYIDSVNYNIMYNWLKSLKQRIGG